MGQAASNSIFLFIFRQGLALVESQDVESTCPRCRIVCYDSPGVDGDSFYVGLFYRRGLFPIVLGFGGTDMRVSGLSNSTQFGLLLNWLRHRLHAKQVITAHIPFSGLHACLNTQ